jgi:hypothetical protein
VKRLLPCLLAACAAAPPAPPPASVAIEATPPAAPAPPRPAEVTVDEGFEPPECEGSVEERDLDGDGRTDVFTVRDGERLVCSANDFTGDGRPDQLEAYDGEGRRRVVLFDLDENGRYDAVERYRDGVCFARDVDLDGDGARDRRDPC